MNIKELLPKPDDLELFASLKEWLPSAIIDAHMHVHKGVGNNLFNPEAKSPGQMFNWFDQAEHKAIFNSFGLFPLDYRAIIFGLPFSCTEEENNYYLQTLASVERNFYAIPCLTNNPVTENNFFSNFIGLKTKIRTNYSTDEIINNFSEMLWNDLNSSGKFLIIHLPKNIWENADELVFLANKYKKINFIIAHMGGTYLFDDRLTLAIKKIALCRNISFDTSMITDPNVIHSVIDIIGCHRVLFGSDAPFGYIRGTFFPHQGTSIFKPDFNWAWVKPDLVSTKASTGGQMVFLQSIAAIKAALRAAHCDSENNRNSIFCLNALKLLRNL